MVEAWIVILFYFVLATTLWSVVTWAWVYLRSALRGRLAQKTTTSPHVRTERRPATTQNPQGEPATPRKKATRIALVFGAIDLLIILLCVIAYLAASGELVGELIAYGLIITLVHVGLCWALQYSKRKKSALQPLPRIQ